MSDNLSMDQVLIEKLNKILEVNLDKEDFGVKELAFEAGLSRSQLHRKLQSIKGKSTSKFICEFRLKKAMEMLQNNVATASEIAYRVGFSSPTYFNTCFHDCYGYPPGEAKIRNPKDVDHNEDEQVLKLIDGVQAISINPSAKKNIFGKRMVWINTFFILLLSIITYSLYQNYKEYFSNETAYPNDFIGSVAILPFKNLSEAKEDEFFTEGVTNSLQNQLNTINGLKVISSNSMEEYTDTKMSPSEIANEIGVTYLMDGSVQKYGDSIKVIINFIDAREDHQLSSLVYIEKFNNLFALQSNIAKQVTQELNIKLSQEQLEQFDKHPTDNLEAYNLYLKGRFFWHQRTKEGINKGIDYFKQAVELDSTYTLAYAGLADSYFVLPWYIYTKDKDSVFIIAKEYAEKALSLDNNNSEAHATLGSILCYKDWNWEASEKELKLAIKLKPNYATARQYYAELLEILGRAKEAREQIDLALRLNPNSYIMTFISARLYYKNGLYEKAIIEANKAKELNNKSFSPYGVIINCYTYMGKDDEAMAEWEEELKLYPDQNIEVTEGRREAFKKSGIKGVWKFTNDRMINSDNADIYAHAIAGNYAYLGETEKALEYLELAYEQRSFDLVWIKLNYDLKTLRDEPRFLALLKKMNLGDYE